MQKLATSLRLLGFGAVASVTLSLPAPAMAANTWDLISRSIPASACAVRNSADASRVELFQGGWRFQGNQTGTVVLTCPLPITDFPADHNLGFSTTVMEFYRVWYRDGDGAHYAAQVSVIPYLRMHTGSVSNIGRFGRGGAFIPTGLCQFNSNAYGYAGVFTARMQDCHSRIQLNALYWFEVTLQRLSSQSSVEFHGIDFHDGSRPAG